MMNVPRTVEVAAITVTTLRAVTCVAVRQATSWVLTTKRVTVKASAILPNCFPYTTPMHM